MTTQCTSLCTSPTLRYPSQCLSPVAERQGIALCCFSLALASVRLPSITRLSEVNLCLRPDMTGNEFIFRLVSVCNSMVQSHSMLAVMVVQSHSLLAVMVVQRHLLLVVMVVQSHSMLAVMVVQSLSFSGCDGGAIFVLSPYYIYSLPCSFS